MLDKKRKHTIEVVVDRLAMKPTCAAADAVDRDRDRARRGLVVIDVVDGEDVLFSENFACPERGVSLPELEPRSSPSTRRTAPARGAPVSARSSRSTPTCSSPTRACSIEEGALVPWSLGGPGFYEAVIQAIAERYEIPTSTTPWRELDAASSRTGSSRDGRRPDPRHVPQPDGPQAPVHDGVRGARPEPPAALPRDRLAQQRERIEEYMSMRPCPVCNGARLKPEALAVTVGGRSSTSSRSCRSRARSRFLDELELTPTEQLIGRRIVKEIRERLTFLDDVGVGYLKLDRAARTLSGGEAQRLRLATQIGSQLVGVLYILDEPSIGLHQRDNDRLIGTLERLRDLGNTVLVVEHDEQMMRTADWLVDMGPGAGEHGGEVVAEGTARRRDAQPALGHRAVPLRQARDRRAAAARGRSRARSASAARASTT